MPYVIIRSTTCSDLIFSDHLGSLAEIVDIRASLIGIPCDLCGRVVEDVDVYVVAKEEEELFSRNEVNVGDTSTEFVRTFQAIHREKAVALLLEKMGGRPDEDILAPIRTSVLSMTPDNLRSYLSLMPVGLNSSYYINAFCGYLSPGCSIPGITFHWGLASYIFFMNRTVVPLFDMTYLGEESKTGKIGHPSTISGAEGDRMSVNAVRRFMRPNVSEPPDLPQLTEPQRALEFALTRTIEKFVLAHEYAHAILGHLQSPPQREHEFEADLWAQKLLAGRLQPKENDSVLARLEMSPEFYHAAPMIFFLYAEFLERFNSSRGAEIFENNGDLEVARRLRDMARQQKSDYHPSPRERFLYMHELLDRIGHWRGRQLVRITTDVISARLERLFGQGIDNPMGELATFEQKVKASELIGKVLDDFPTRFEELHEPVLPSLERELEQGLRPPLHCHLPAQDKRLSMILSSLEGTFWAANRCMEQGKFPEAVAGFQQCLAEVETTLAGIEGETHAVEALRIIQSGCYFKLGDIMSPFDLRGKAGLGADAAVAEHHFLKSIAVAYAYQSSDRRVMMYFALQQIARLRAFCGEIKGAIEAARIAVKLESNSCGAHLLLAEQYNLAGLLQEAFESLLRATDCQQDNGLKGRAFWLAAAVAVKLGKFPDAKRCLSLAVKDFQFGSIKEFLSEEGITDPSLIEFLRQGLG